MLTFENISFLHFSETRTELKVWPHFFLILSLNFEQVLKTPKAQYKYTRRRRENYIICLTYNTKALLNIKISKDFSFKKTVLFFTT